jgi:hypothetical protein
MYMGSQLFVQTKFAAACSLVSIAIQLITPKSELASTL